MPRVGSFIALLFALVGMPAVSAATAEPEPDFIAINQRGSVPVEREGGTFVWTPDLFSLTTGAKIGTFTDRATCSTSAPPPCLIYDITTTYRVPGGEVVSRAQWSVTPDPSRPGFAFGGSRPETDTIISATGRFAGRPGRAAGWGTVDLRDFPAKIGLDLFTLIRFHPTNADVLGRRELFAGQEPGGIPKFQTELFRSEGIDESSDPARFRYTTPLLSLSDGSRKATAIDEFTCATGPPPSGSPPNVGTCART